MRFGWFFKWTAPLDGGLSSLKEERWLPEGCSSSWLPHRVPVCLQKVNHSWLFSIGEHVAVVQGETLYRAGQLKCNLHPNVRFTEEGMAWHAACENRAGCCLQTYYFHLGHVEGYAMVWLGIVFEYFKAPWIAADTVRASRKLRRWQDSREKLQSRLLEYISRALKFEFMRSYRT